MQDTKLMIADWTFRTKAQTAASEILLTLANKEVPILNWDDIVTHVKASKGAVKNWMTIRGVLQTFINEGHIVRVRDVRDENYVAV